MTVHPYYLIVGDVHGDLERLFRSLAPHPAEGCRTIFLGDLVDGGLFGVGALRYARDREHSEVLIGNHEVMMLAALSEYPERGPHTVFWLGLGGQPHDLRELASDDALADWLRNRPAALFLEDGSLAQHCDSDALSRFIDIDDPEPVSAVNRAVAERLRDGRYQELWDAMSTHGVFSRQPARLASWLARTGAKRLVHGHTPVRGPIPKVYAGGLALNFDPGRGRPMAAPLP